MHGNNAETPLWGLLDPGIRPAPYPHHRRLRESGPIHHDPMGAFLLTRHADCAALLRDPRFGHGKLVTARPDGSPQAQVGRPFLFLNPPRHTRLRHLVGKAFAPPAVAMLRPRIERLVAQLLDDAIALGEVDLISTFAYPLPMMMICDLLGVPTEDHGMLQQWSHDLAMAFDPDFDFLQPPDILVQRDRAWSAFAEYFLDLAERRRRRPQADLISQLTAVEEHGDILSQEELLNTCELLLVAGHETTVNLLGNGTLALLRHPDQLDLLRRDPRLAGNAVEELLRYDSPLQFIARTALTDAQFAGRYVLAGELVIALVAAANRDPEVFNDPDRLDLARSPGRHLGFGLGIHSCLGARLARLEGQIALTALASLPGLALAGEPVYRDNPVLRGPASLPVRLR
ncbi:cytochrome P450 [Kibdelosporangium banguiense]|uniref:Cytochrome P450 n=1 Tax=Kibdelosporangium banguiense TaxID=1365924 RepID=A0ABS4TW74_9PSEU|nr:cytochrome P450 [Kibdelosporangium banguiense]MBP2328618.1 cytochrome P450 [Kibdelosporangium banguiense]